MTRPSGTATRRTFGGKALLVLKIVAGTTLGLGVTTAVVLSLDLAVTRRVVARIANRTLRPVFRGRLTIESLGRLGVEGFSGARVRIDDPRGHPVLVADGVYARVRTFAILKTLIGGGKTIEIDIPEASVDHADLLLDTDAAGMPLLQDALTPAAQSETNAPPGPPGPLVRVVIGHATAKHVWVHGQPTWAPPLDLEVAGAEGKVVVNSTGSVEIDVHQGRLRARALPVAGGLSGDLHGRVLVPSEHGNAIGLNAAFDGSVGDLEESARVSLDGNVLSATLDTKALAPEKVRALVPGYPLQDLLTMHVGARGTYPELAVEGRAHLRGGGDLVTSGTVILSETQRASLHATLAAIDLRGLAPGMPVSSLGASVDATLGLGEGHGLTGAVTVVSEGGTIGDQVLPAAEVHATFSTGARGPSIDGRADAAIAFRDPGLSGNATLHVYPHGKSFEVAFDARARAPRLDGAPRLRLPTTRGSAFASARGAVDLDTFTLAADVDADAQGLAQGPMMRAGTASGSAHVAGSVFAPRVDAKVHATGIDLGIAHADQGELTAVGPVRAPHVHLELAGGNVPDLSLEADVALGADTVLRDLRGSFSRAADRAELRADSVRVTARGVTAERVAVDGLGGPLHADVRLTPNALEVQATGSDVDVGRAARLAGAEGWVSSGKLAFSVGAVVRGAKADGHATFDLTGGEIAGQKGASAHAEVALDDRRLTGRAHAELGDLGSLDLVGHDLQVGKEGASSLRSWQRIWGGLEGKATLDAARLEALLPVGALPFHLARGRLELSGSVRRDSATDDTPQLALSVVTSGLVAEAPAEAPAAGATGRDAASAAVKWRVEGVDLGVDARIDGDSGFAEVAARAMDARGPIVSIDAKSAALPYTALMTSPGRARELLSGVAFDASIVVPRRDVATLPPAIDVGGATGDLAAEARLHGTLDAPEIELTASLREARTAAAHFSLPVDVELTSHYAAGRADAELVASAGRGARVLAAEAHAEGRLPDLLAHPAQAAWSASGRAHLEQFPLAGVGFLDDRQVRGHVSGDIVLDGLHRDARATVDLATADLQVGEVDYKDARVHAAFGGTSIDADVHVDHGDGSAEAHALAGAAWGAAIVPSVTPPVTLSLTAKAFRAETLLPFAHETLAELEGRIDGKAHVAYDPREGKTQLEGTLAYTHGKLELSSVLGELHDARATLVLTPDGVVRLEDATASGVTGQVKAAASARLAAERDGLFLQGARARIEIPKKTPLPITLEGSPLGTIDGVIEIREEEAADRRGLGIDVDVPTLHVQLPESGSRNLQSLGELDAADVGVHRTRAARPGVETRELVLVPLGPPREEKTRAANARRIEITTHLGADVEVKRGVDLKVGLEGQPVVTVTDQVHATGQIRLKKGGLLDVQGRSFEIEKGTVTFVGKDPENPQVVVTASWNAPDGTRIFADYLGPLRTGKVTLRSEPPLPQTEIVALLLFGSVESSSGGGQSTTNTTTGAAVGQAGNVATQPINHALDQFGVHAVAARVDTTQAANPKPEVELQIAKDISVQLAVVIGTPPPGSNPDTTLLTLNWRLLRGLTVATTVGNSGSSIVDMVWERRY